jgi:hypothetical protein
MKHVHAVFGSLLLSLVMTAHALGQAKIGPPVEVDQKINLPLDVPTRGKLFCLQSEEKLRQGMAQEYASLGQKKVTFPTDARVEFSASALPLPPVTATVENADIYTGVRYFEDENTERYGIYCPLLQPLISTSRFYLDTLCLPVNLILSPPGSPRCWPDGVGVGHLRLFP